MDSSVTNYEESGMGDYVYVYGFYQQMLTSTRLVYAVDEMTDEFMNLENGEGTFNGIRMKKQDGILYFSVDDLDAKDIEH